MGRKQKPPRTSFASTWVKKLNDNRKKGIGVDCTIVVVNQEDNSTIRKDVHSQVICTASDLCQRSLTKYYCAAQERQEITISHSASEDALDDFLDLIYVERFDPASKTACEVISLSQTLEVSSEVIDDLLTQVHREIKSEKRCENLIKLVNQTRANPFRLFLVSKTMVSWVNIHAESLFPRRRRTNRQKGVTLWESAVDLLTKSEEFKKEWTIMDVLKWIKLDHEDIEFAYLLNNILPNQLVQIDPQAKSVVVRSICSVAEIRREHVTVDNCFQIRDLQRACFANEFKKLGSFLQNFIITNFEMMTERQEFHELDSESLILFLICRRQRVSGYIKFTPIAMWVKNKKADIEKSPKVFIEVTNILFDDEVSKASYRYLRFLKSIELESFSCEFLLCSVLDHSLTQKDKEAQKIVSKAICSRLDADNSELTKENFIRIQSLIRLHQIDHYSGLNNGIFHLVITNVGLFVESGEFLETTHDQVINIFTSPDLSPLFEEQKLCHISKWINHKVGRNHWLRDLFDTIQIQRLSKEFVSKMICHPLLECNYRCLHRVIDELNNCRRENNSDKSQTNHPLSRNSVET